MVRLCAVTVFDRRRHMRSTGRASLRSRRPAPKRPSRRAGPRRPRFRVCPQAAVAQGREAGKGQVREGKADHGREGQHHQDDEQERHEQGHLGQVHLTTTVSSQCVLWSALYVYVDRCLLALVTGVLELVYLQPLALRKNVHQSWPLALSWRRFLIWPKKSALKSPANF